MSCNHPGAPCQVCLSLADLGALALKFPYKLALNGPFLGCSFQFCLVPRRRLFRQLDL